MNKIAIAVLVAACFVAAVTAGKKNKPESNNDIVPVLTKGKSIIIKNEGDNIIIDGEEIIKNEQNLREGKLRVDLENGNLYVNKKLVIKQDPNAPVITKNPDLKARKIRYFEINIDKQGEVTYVLRTSI